MDLQIRGKRMLVTGSTAGIGYAIAECLAAEGAEVIVSGRTSDRVEAALASIADKVPKAHVRGIAADLRTEEGVHRVLREAPMIDVLVNNVGAYGAKRFEDLTTADWMDLFELNVLSGARLSQYYLPQMLACNAGRVVFISSESAVQIPVEMIHYGVTKAAQAALARGLAERTRGTAVTVNTVLAGPTKSEGVERFVTGLARDQGVSEQQVEKEFFSKTRPTSLLQRFAKPKEVAHVVAFLVSPLASAVNGASVRAEGGVLLSVF